jgi:predicted adenine nucleotide alpha hydrolase (AANH) superfamily ATPase
MMKEFATETIRNKPKVYLGSSSALICMVSCSIIMKTMKTIIIFIIRIGIIIFICINPNINQSEEGSRRGVKRKKMVRNIAVCFLMCFDVF